jgi:hypothetical protein
MAEEQRASERPSRASVWIRTADREAWAKAPNKSEVIHVGLIALGLLEPAEDEPVLVAETRRVAADGSAPARDDARQALDRDPLRGDSLNRDSVSMCGNGHPLASGRTGCMAKGCKYSIYAKGGK